MKNMRVLLLLLSCVSFSHVSAQSWCPPGATWYFRYNDMTTGGYVLYNYDKDTTINQIDCKRISGTLYEADYPNNYKLDTGSLAPIFTYFSGDTVYFLRDTLFQPYFYFNAHFGDTLLISGQFALVDSNGIMRLNNQNLRYYFFHFLDSCLAIYDPYEEKVVERIGIFTNNLVPQWFCATDGGGYGFHCYEDDSLPLYTADTVERCDFIYTDGTGITSINALVPIKIYPNPANDFCTLRLDAMGGAYTAMFIDITGREIMTFKITNTNTQIPITNLPAGLYFVKVSDGPDSSRYLSGREGHVGVAKLIRSAE